MSESTPAEPPAQVERWAELVLVSPEGALLGKLPALKADIPWWPEVASIVRDVRDRHGLEVTVLRLLHAERSAQPGGRVTYLAEVQTPVHGLQPCAVALDEHPLRRGYAKPGGPRRDLDWAASRLAARGQGPVLRAEQIKTWNLSSLWRLGLPDGVAWLKVVPPFFAHEGALIAAL
ncbi:MAG TPA: hypothetical protein VJU61_27980, partial [Polyangiaceae bacterium]|nr:hypothetical protein [Polyangiaceae bacterium]